MTLEDMILEDLGRGIESVKKLHESRPYVMKTDIKAIIDVLIRRRVVQQYRRDKYRLRAEPRPVPRPAFVRHNPWRE